MHAKRARQILQSPRLKKELQKKTNRRHMCYRVDNVVVMLCRMFGEYPLAGLDKCTQAVLCETITALRRPGQTSSVL